MCKYNSVCFTGHRNVHLSPKLDEALKTAITSYINNGATTFLAGGAMGWDMICERAVIEMKNKYQDIKLCLVLPCPPNEQTLKWSERSIDEYNEILHLADEIEICSEHYSNSCMKVRNARLIELADVCVCFYNEKRNKSGTAQTIRMAKNKGIEIINLR